MDIRINVRIILINLTRFWTNWGKYLNSKSPIVTICRIGSDPEITLNIKGLDEYSAEHCGNSHSYSVCLLILGSTSYLQDSLGIAGY